MAAPPSVRLSLSRVGLTGVERVIHLGADGRGPQPAEARLDCFVELGRTVRDSRFQDAIGDAVGELALDRPGMRADRLAQQLAETVRERLNARRAEVSVAARFPERRLAPVSGTPSQEISSLYGRAVASERGTRRTVGVAAQGMTTSPHAQAVLAARARERLAAEGFSHARIARIVEHVPVATHSQLGVGTLHLGAPEGCETDFDVAVMLAVVEQASSSEIFELLKRGDEAAVVERAHRRPRFADDCVRAMIAAVVERFADLPGDVFVAAHQANLETIHRHKVTAECAGLLGELKREVTTHTSLGAWLSA